LKKQPKEPILQKLDSKLYIHYKWYRVVYSWVDLGYLKLIPDWVAPASPQCRGTLPITYANVYPY
jgi:hypothetical protein